MFEPNYVRTKPLTRVSNPTAHLLNPPNPIVPDLPPPDSTAPMVEHGSQPSKT